MRTLLVDNYDSYTYNVFHLLAGVSGEEPIVIDNDAISWRALSRWDFDAIVLSPGPGHPARWHDFGVCQDILRYSEVPVLGICLGHQGLGRVLDGVVGSAPMAMHGRLSRIRHVGKGIFRDIPQDFSVVRYHSLTITSSLGPHGRVTAWTDDGIVMGIEHLRRPLWGVQFHPESISTEHGQTLIRNFYELAARRREPRRRPPRSHPAKPLGAAATAAATAAARPRRGAGDGAGPESAAGPEGAEPAGPAAKPRLAHRAIDGEPATEPLFERLFGAAENAFWLDSADAPTWLARASYMGTGAGPRRCLLSYDVTEGRVEARRAGGGEVRQGSIFEALDEELAGLRVEPPEGIARGLVGGFVGYLGYECKADCGSPNAHASDIPDALLMLADRVVAVDHEAGRTHLLALCAGDEEEVERWLDEAEAVVRAELASPSPEPPLPAPPPGEEPEPVEFRLGRGRERYLADVGRCHEELLAGESYEVCLTDQISTDASPDPFGLYRVLRRRNPAPFAAFLRFGEVAVVSSSPERFLSVGREREVQARPIKGTTSRAAEAAEDAARRRELAGDEKTQAEHLMIVDLLRNDLGRVCEVDSVGVPDLMVIEPYATVHQMVSTVTGRLDPQRTPVECVRACFPGGSMTGAPKLRTMEIIDEIEAEARGVYSGALGYFGLDGSVDLSIVIRTIVMRPGRTTIGAGGAIVMQSDPQDEFDEFLLKARAPMAAIAEALGGPDAAESWRVELEPRAAAGRAA